MMRLQQQHFTPVTKQQQSIQSSPYVVNSSSTTTLLKKNNNGELDSSCSTNGSSKSTSSISAVIQPDSSSSPSTSFLLTKSDQSSFRKFPLNSANQQQEKEKFSMHPINSQAISTLQRFQQQQQLIGTPTNSSNNRRTTMYRLSSFNEQSSSSPPGLSSATNNNVGGDMTNEPLPLMTPTYESIDVNNLIDNNTTNQTAANSSQGTSDGGHCEESTTTATMSDNPTVTIPDNHRLFAGSSSHHHSYYNRNTSSIMPMSGIMTPFTFGHHNHHQQLLHNHNNHYPFTSNIGGYLTRSSHYYYHNPDYYHHQYGLHNVPMSSSSSSPPLLYVGHSGDDDIDDTRNSSSFHPSSTVTVSPFNNNNNHIKDEQDFDIFNAIFALISLMLYCCCSGSTLILAYFLWRHEQDWLLFLLTIFSTLIPSIIVNIISLKWLLNDNHRQQYEQQQQQQQNNNNISNGGTTTTNETTTFFLRRPNIGPCGWMFRILLHIILLGPVLRYVELLRYGVKSWSDKRRRVDYHNNGGQKDGGGGWSSTTTALPSLSTTLPRPRFQSSIGPGSLPDFEPAVNKSNTQEKSSFNRIDYYLLTVAEDRDTSLLSLFQCLMQCTIQMILHLHSLISHWYFEHHHHLNNYNHNYTEYVQITVILLALFETSWSISSYHRALRRASYDKRNLSAFGTIIQSCWHCLTLASRLLAISLFLHQFGYWLLPIGIGHWGIMTIWIMHQGTHFFDTELGRPNPCQEYMFNMLIGLIYLFVFINLKDEPTRFKYLAFYTIIMAEDITFASLWFLRIETDYFWSLHSILFAAVPILFIASILVMQFYYWFVHPNGRPLIINKAARCC
ncbi:uncharacterized protein LOC113791528 [Dermatophagoides pteronyssinus]|uniref:uncharacterized protein LOC113791528 n=1 Tax=Dermatophagoides pteronyssinus TaxID=6956 RepID=UPI003F665AF1